MSNPFNSAFEWLRRLPRPFVAALVVILTAAIASLDRATGVYFSLSVFYLAPISLAAWRIGARSGIVTAICSAIILILLNPRELHGDLSSVVVIWNMLILGCSFTLFAIIVTKACALLDKERNLARTDFLTGTLNRMAFLNEVDQEILRALRHGQPLSLIYVDLDNFKSINDRLGHREGDRLLAAVGQTLLQTIRGIDSVARLGGDEFVILLPNADSEAAAVVAPRIRQNLLARMREDLWPVTFSVGVLTCPVPPGSAEQLIHRADELMYRAKHGGKDKLVFSIQSA